MTYAARSAIVRRIDQAGRPRRLELGASRQRRHAPSDHVTAEICRRLLSSNHEIEQPSCRRRRRNATLWDDEPGRHERRLLGEMMP
jgi:hypothetical protein